MKYSATSRLGEGVEMSKQLSQQTGWSCSSSYGLVLVICYTYILFEGLSTTKQAHNWSYKTGQFVETIVLTSQHPLQAYWLQSISPRAPHPASLVM